MTRAKKFMSDFMRGHGRVPALPIPRRIAAEVVVDAMGVVATMRVRGWESIGESVEWVLAWVGWLVLDILH